MSIPKKAAKALAEAEALLAHLKGPPNRAELMAAREEQKRKQEDDGEAQIAAIRDALERGDVDAGIKAAKKLKGTYTVPARPPRHQRPRCGAMTRKGTPCRAPAVWFKGELTPRNGRCKHHGGLSTGPTTEAGKRAVAEAVAERNRQRARNSRNEAAL